ncbi:Serine/threonine-protein kinase PrkC [Neorhodopirellula pilleata]|uniref:Serine/threonine-protein kinase PrkC n=1 Tax=Neorhodopirellula pilleata TaxID=2714738 RepID=A0A5C5ZKX1_9BACT|nr:Serine/threonine-protein kinase PrkC [Neorhodopirellula pilleata]
MFGYRDSLTDRFAFVARLRSDGQTSDDGEMPNSLPNDDRNEQSSLTPEMTEAQSVGGQAAARRMSLQATVPPADVPGVRVERFLGAGAFGQVWVGRDLNTGRGVAVKFYLHRGGVNWSLLSREVKNLVQLSADRHVVQVLEVGWDADPPYYVMELIEGGSLEEMLQRRGRLPVGEAVDLFSKICTGLNHCHGKGVLHCDVKPANVLLAADNEPRLADFGQSRMSHDQTPAMGTLFYMAPEQADLNSTPDSRWDVYAAGALLYRMLSGNAPHREASLLSQLDTAGSLPGRLARYREAIANSPPAVDQLPRRSIDRPLRRILQKCLEVDPKNRYANMQQVIDDLARRDAARTRQPLMLLGIVGPLLLLLATCVFAFRSIDRATESATNALRTEAFGSNQLAARFAAQTLETEIHSYFELCNQEASRKSFQTLLQATLEEPAIETALQAIGESESSEQALKQTDARDTLLDSQQRLKLNQYLEDRLALYTPDASLPEDESRRKTRQRLASLFVCDAKGTILAIAYGKPVKREDDSAGRNFAYRTYYNGLRDDLSKTTPLDEITPLKATHLSSAFQSTATGLWKVAISTPIRLPGDSQSGSSDVDAVFVMTINLGDFRLLQSRREASQVAVLIEARQGPLRGLVLQHPLMDSERTEGETLSEKRYQVPEPLLNRLVAGDDAVYHDPMAQAKDGSEFAGDWLAAMQPITLPESQYAQDDAPTHAPTDAQAAERRDRETDLLVLVQYRLSEVLGPVGQLRKSLFQEGLASIASILFVTFALWWVVRRVTDDERLDGVTATEDETPPEAIETSTLG